MIYTVILRIHNIVWVIIRFMPSVIKLVKRSAKFGNEFKSNEVSCFYLFFVFVKFIIGMADNKQLLFKDTNGKIALR